MADPSKRPRRSIRSENDLSSGPVVEPDSGTEDSIPAEGSRTASTPSLAEAEVLQQAETLDVELPSGSDPAEPSPWQRPEPLDHPTLHALEQLFRKGQYLKARLGYQKLADSIELSEDDHGPFGEAVWLEASRGEFESSRETAFAGEAMSQLRSRFKRFDKPEWQSLREKSSDYYEEMISLSVDVGLDEQALEIFEQSREHVKLTPVLRRKLLEVSIRLGKADPGTARLCIEEAFSRTLEPKEFDRLMRVIRQAIRIGMTNPADDLIDEFAGLNEEIRQQTDLRWPLAHLAMAACRQDRLEEAVQFAEAAGPQGDADTDSALLLGASFYFAKRIEPATSWFEHASRRKGSRRAQLAEFLLELVQLNRLLYSGGHELADRAAFKAALNKRIAGLTARTVPEAWQLDSDWLLACAHIHIGQVEKGLQGWEAFPTRFASWPTVDCLHETLRINGRTEDAENLAAMVQEASPFLSSLLKVRTAVREFRFDEAAGIVATLKATASQERDGTLLSVAECVSTEVAMASAATEQKTGEFVRPESSTARDVTGDWREQLEIRRLIEHSRFELAEQQLSQVKWLTVPAVEAARLQAVLEFARDPDAPLAERFSEICSSPASLPVDRLNRVFVKHRASPRDAQDELESMHKEWPDCLEVSLAVLRGRLAKETTESEPDVAGFSESEAAITSELQKLCTLSTWQNRTVSAWVRPWQHLVPAGDSVPGAAVKPARLADMLQATDLQQQCGLLEDSVRTLGQLESLAGDASTALRAPVSERFETAATHALEKSEWDQACQWHREAVARGGEENDFAERLAGRFSDAPSAPDTVIAVFFEWTGQFTQSESDFLTTQVGRTLVPLLQIDRQVPEHAEELAIRRYRLEELNEIRPDWDLPKRGLAFAAARDGNDRLVVSLVESITEKRPAEQELIGHALWRLRRFAESDVAFAAAGTPGWNGCARAAARLVEMEQNGQWLSGREADAILKLLDAAGLDAKQAARVREWRIAIQLGARRGEIALAELIAANESEWLHLETMRASHGLALLLAGRKEEACLQFCPEELRDGELTRERVDGHQEGIDLFLLVRLALPDRSVLPQLHRMLTDLRKLNDQQPAFLLAQAHLALLQTDPRTARRHLDQLNSQRGQETKPDGQEAGLRDSPPEKLLLASLNPLLRAEAGFVEARIQMQSGDVAEAAKTLEANAPQRLWPEPNQYWQSLCLLSSGKRKPALKMLEELTARLPLDATAAAQLAAIHLQSDDWDAAARWQAEASNRDPGHPFALLVKGQLSECSDETDEARRCFEKLAGIDELAAGRRCQAAARLALGRFAQAAGNLDEAVVHFREASRLHPENPVCVRRLGLMLAVNAQSEEDWRTADRNLEAVEKLAPDDPLVLLGRISTADALEQTDLLAERLTQLVQHAEFGRLPASVQRDLALLSADTQLRRKEFGAAADALDRLFQQQPEEKIQDRLRKCRLLQALQLVGTRPIPDGALEKIRMAAEAVCEGADAPAHAVLLKIIAVLLLGELAEQKQREAALAEVHALTIDDEGLQDIAMTTRLWLGDDSIREELTGRLSTKDRTELRTCVELIAASLNQDGTRFRDEAQRLTSDETGEISTPFNPDEVVLVGALAGVKSQKDRSRTCDVLEQWHDQGRGNSQTRLVHSQLLADQGVRALKGRNFGSSRSLLKKAIEVITEAG